MTMRAVVDHESMYGSTHLVAEPPFSLTFILPAAD
jgi:hypothetical protein